MSIINKHSLSLSLVAALLCLLICAGCGADDPATASSYTVAANLKSQSVDLNSKIPGNIEQICVAEGDEVKAGDLLITIDARSLLAKKQQAQGAVAAAQATCDKAVNGARSGEVTQAKAARDLAEKTYTRVKSLYEQEAVSENQFDQVYTQYIAAEQTYQMALDGARSEDIAAAQALLTQAQGALAEVESYLADCQITSPLDGVVTAINVSVGALISTGMPLATVDERSNYHLEANIDESWLSFVQQGGTVEIEFAAYPNEQVTGTVTQISQKPDFATKKATGNTGGFDLLSYTINIDLNDCELTIYPGMTANVTFAKPSEA